MTRRERIAKSVMLPVLALVLWLPLLAGNALVHAQTQIMSVEVNQALGVQKDNNQNYVAGKNTAVRVFLSAPAAIDPDETKTYVNVLRDGSPVVGLSPKKYTKPVNTVDFFCDSMKDCGNWAAGNYTFQAMVNGQGGTVNGTYKFVNGSSIRILAVPVKANYGGTVKSVPNDKWKTMWKFLQNVYPVANGNVKWEIRETGLDASASGYNLLTNDGQYAVWSKLKDYILPICKTKPQTAGCFDLIVGFIPESFTDPDDPTSTLQGFMWRGAPVNVSAATDEDASATVAHETGHVYGLGDTYNGGSVRCGVNPPPDSYSGKDWVTRLLVPSCSAGRPASTLIGPTNPVSATQTPESAHPYEMSGRGALGEMADFMGSGGKQSQYWITPDGYDWLYRRLVNKEADPASRTPADVGSPQRLLSFYGTITEADVVVLEPWKSFMDTTEVSDTSGSFMVRAVNGTGGIGASTAFTVDFYAMSPPGRPMRKVAKAHFSGVIRFPAETAKFQIVKDGKVLIEVPVSANPPTVTSVSPASTTTISGLYTITWNANDPDGTSLTYMVEYNADVTRPDSPWMILADDLATTSWQEDFSLLPGGSHAKIRITADDGVLSTSAESAEFSVPLKNPEIFIGDLPWGTKYPVGGKVLLTADAFDLQDEWLPDSRIKWTSSLSGALGYGAELIARNLAPGSHTITATATNSGGLTASASVAVQIMYSVSGNVKNLVTQASVSGALVTAQDTISNASAGSGTSDASGNYTIFLADTGFYSISASASGYAESSYPVLVEVTDASPNGTVNRYMEPVRTSLFLAYGWNFISFPQLPVNPASIQAVLKDVSPGVRIVWGYDNQNKVWLKYSPNLSLRTPNSLDKVEYGKGYWIYMDSPGTIDLIFWNPPASVDVHLYAGWNLVGYHGEDGLAAAAVLSDPSINWSIVWNWYGNQWSAIHRTIKTLPVPSIESFYLSRAYWIRAN